MTLQEALDAPVPAVVLAEGEFGEPDGKTANGVVMHSELFDVGAVVDSTSVGRTASAVLGRPDIPDVPVVSSVSEALEEAPETEALVVGIAPVGGALPDALTRQIEDAIKAGCDVVSGLHAFLSDSERWSALAAEHGVKLFDVRRTPDVGELRIATGRAVDVDADVVLVAGTDCATGKRTTCFELYRAARERGLDAEWVATGQTGILVGADRGVVVDRVPADFVAGVVEDMVVDVAEGADLVFVEGQAAITHRSYGGVSLGILQGAWPDSVVIVDDPDRAKRAMGRFTVPAVSRERDLIETLSEATVAAVSTWGEPATATAESGLPAANVYHRGGAEKLLEAVLEDR